MWGGFSMTRKVKLGCLSLLALLVYGTVLLPSFEAQKKSTSSPVGNPAGKIDDAALNRAGDRKGDWITHGRDYAETRFSPLRQVNDANVKDLGLAWSFETNTNRGLEATPIIVDGV